MAYDPNLPPWAQPQPDVAPPEPAPLPPATLPPWAREEEPVDVVVAEGPIEPVEPAESPMADESPLPEATGVFAPDLGDATLQAPAGLPGMGAGITPELPEEGRPFSVEQSLGAPELAAPPVAASAGELAAMEAPWEQEAAAGPSGVAPGDLSDEALLARQMERIGQAQEEADLQRAAQRQDLEDQEEALAMEQELNLTRLEELNAQQAEQAQVRVDPNRFYKNQSTGQKIVGLVAAFASGWLQGKKGGKNIYLDHIQGEVQRDIDAQLADIANERKGIGAAIGNVKQLVDAGVRQKQAIYLTFDRAMLDVDQRLANEQAKFLPGGTSAEAIEGARRDLQSRRAAGRMQAEKELRKENRDEAELRRKIKKDERQWLIDRRKLRPRGTGRGKGAGVDAVAFNDPNAVRSEFGGVVGRFRKDVSAAEKAAYRKRKMVREGLARELREIVLEYQVVGKIYGGPGSDRFGQSERAVALQSRYADLFNRYKKDLTGAAANKEEMASMQRTMPDPAGMLKRSPVSAWKAALKSMGSHQSTDNTTHMDRKYDPTKDYLSGLKVAGPSNFGTKSQNEVLEKDANANNLTSALEERARQYSVHSGDVQGNADQIIRPGERKRIVEAGKRAVEAARSPDEEARAKAAAARAANAFDGAVQKREARRKKLGARLRGPGRFTMSYKERQDALMEFEALGGKL